MKRSLLTLYLLTACAAPPQAFTPVAVDMPIALACLVPEIAKPPDSLAKLNAASGIADVTRACLQQVLDDKIYETELAAAQRACR